MLMVCLQVMGNDTTVTMAGAEGNFELNAFRPIVISNFLHSAALLADASINLARYLVDGAVVNERQVAENVDRAVMTATALSPIIGYERTADVVQRALTEDLPIREAALAEGVDAADVDSALGRERE